MIQLENIVPTSYIHNNIALNIQSKMEKIRRSYCQRSIIVGDISTFHSVTDI